jgi:ATP/maltotriose-dependent transcriptional regulator MalT/DNA-binding SARP family transcriptional activator
MPDPGSAQGPTVVGESISESSPIDETLGPNPSPGYVGKVMLPRRRPDVLSRPRLVSFLQQHLDRRLVLVCAPPGYGKTTLLVDFAQQCGVPVCWYSLTTFDSDPQIFLEYLVLSVRQRFPTFGTRTLRYLRSQGPKDPEVATGLVVSELHEVPAERFVLCLDDVHTVDESSGLNKLLDTLVSGLPPNCCCVLCSRTIPRIRLSRLVANREAAGLGDADLRFTAAEIQQLFGRYYNILVPDALAEELATEVEGWIAGLILTSHSLWQGLFKGIIQAKRAGGPIFEYLATEVFDHQDSEIKSYLLGVSTLHRINAARCDELLDRDDSERLLAELDRDNLFLSHLGEGWYRFHSLFQEFLQTRLRTDDLAEYRRLQAKAGHMAETEGEPDSAIAHYLNAGEAALAAALVERRADEQITYGRLQTVLRWCGQLPPAALEERPFLQIIRARAAIDAGDLTAAEEALQSAWDVGVARDDRRTKATTLLWRSALRRPQGRFGQAVQDCQAGLALAEELADAALLALGHLQLGISYGAQGEAENAVPALEKALAGYERAEDWYRVATLCHSLGIACLQLGDLERAQRELGRANHLWQNLHNRGMRAGTLIVLGNLHADNGELGEAERILTEAEEEARSSGYLRLEGYAAQSCGDVLRDQRKFEAARQTYERGLLSADRVGDRFLQVVSLESLARSYLYAGSVGLAHATIARARLLADERDSPYEQGLCADTLGLFYLIDGRVDLAERELEKAHGWLDKRGSVRERGRVKLHLAFSLLRRGNRERARQLAVDGLKLFPAGASEPLLAVEGELLVDLLRNVVDAAPDWVRGVVARFPAAEDAATVAVPPTVVAKRSVRCFALGRSDVELDGAPIADADWQTQKTKELWFYLLAEGPAPRSQIIEALWPDSEANRGVSTFHTTLHRLRRALFLDCVERDGELYRVSNKVQVWSDDREFEAQALAFRRPHPAELSEEQLQRAVAAVDLYRGPYLAKFDVLWSDGRRNHLATLYLRVLRTLAEQARRTGRNEEAITFAERYLQTQPDDDSVHELIMRCHVDLGNRPAALRHYRRYAEQLREELATQPSRRLRQLSEQIAREG